MHKQPSLAWSTCLLSSMFIIEHHLFPLYMTVIHRIVTGHCRYTQQWCCLSRGMYVCSKFRTVLADTAGMMFALNHSVEAMQSTTFTITMHWSWWTSLLHGCPEPGLYRYGNVCLTSFLKIKTLPNDHIQNVQYFSAMTIEPIEGPQLNQSKTALTEW